ncbi:MAG: prolyl aminopeptidase [Rudaea sp.]
MQDESAAWPLPATFDANTLALDHGHRLYYEQAGAANGNPVLLLHGGPGSGSSPRQREFFDGEKFRIVQFDQRGCGRSEPRGATAHNNTAALIADIERLREHLAIGRWLVCGGSWGAALALAYAASHRDRVAGLVLRGVFLTGKADLDWFFHGAATLLPEAHLRFIEQIPRRWRRSVTTWLDRSFQSGDLLQQSRLALEWQRYEAALSSPLVAARATSPSAHAAVDTLRATYTIQAHYLAHRCFLGEAAVLRAAANLGGVPVAIVHGTLDFVCRPVNAWRVHRACAGSRLAWAAGAGHDPYHPLSKRLLRDAVECFAAQRDFAQWPSAAGARA